MLGVLVSAIPALFFSLFSFWRKLKEDYVPNSVFSSYILIFVGGLLGLSVSRFVKDLNSFWLISVGGFVSTLIASKLYRLRFFEIFEAATVSFLAFGTIYAALNLLFDFSSEAFGVLAVVACLLALYFILDTHYKSFSWYRSGKVGFSGLTVAGIGFLARAIIALTFPNMLSLSGTIDTMLSAGVAFSAFAAIVFLARGV